MEKEFVSRSRLFREAFLPGAYTRLRNQAYGKVIGVYSGQNSALDGVDKEQLLETVISFIKNWEVIGGSVDTSFRGAIEHKNFSVQSPTEISVSAAPMMLSCKKCKVIDFYDTRLGEEQTLQKLEARIRYHGSRSYISCKRPTCNGQMIQVPYLAVHRCGYSNAIYVHHSARRSSNIGYQDNGSFVHSYFFDVDTNEKLAGSLQDNCPACQQSILRSKEINKRGTPITNGESFYAQSIQYIALSEERGRLIASLLDRVNETRNSIKDQSIDIIEGLGSVLLHRISSREFEQQLKTISLNISVDQQEELRSKLNKKLASILKYESLTEKDELMEEMLNSTRKEVAELEAKLIGSSGNFSSIGEFFPERETIRKIVQNRRAMEALFLEQDVNSISIEKAINQTPLTAHAEILCQQWRIIQGRYGIQSISHIPDLKVVLATLGYTREKSAPEVNSEKPQVNLNAFVDRIDESIRNKASIYAMAAKTEAIWIRLDPRKILSWCVTAAEWDSPGEEILNCREKSHAFLLKHSPALALSPDMVMRETFSTPIKFNAPFHLLHSISHALILTARRHTGYDSKSIQEYLLPMDLSVILYVSSVQNFTAGGLLTLFQHYLNAWFDDASMFALNCAFDPICSDCGGSCSGCLQTEISCETFNHGLSRAYIHGGNINRNSTLDIRKGFWS